MRIWFELANSPQISMFAALIRELEKEHEVIITCHSRAKTIEYLDSHGFNYEIIDQNYDRKLISKILKFPLRVLESCNFILREKFDVAFSQCSYHSTLAAWLCGTRSIYMADNDHSLGNIPAFIFADTIMVPEFHDIEKLKAQHANQEKVLFYPGVREGIYLWEMENSLAANNTHLRKQVYIRPEAWTGDFYEDTHYVFDNLLLALKDHVDVIVLSRSQGQTNHFQDKRFEGVQIIALEEIADIAPFCDLFIGAAETMTREMAVLGIPTISVIQGELPEDERHLLETDTYMHCPELTADQVLKCLDLFDHKPANRGLLKKGRVAYELVKNTILKLGQFS